MSQNGGQDFGGRSQGSGSPCIGGIISLDVKIPKLNFDSEDVNVGRQGNIDKSTNSSVGLLLSHTESGV